MQKEPLPVTVQRTLSRVDDTAVFLNITKLCERKLQRSMRRDLGIMAEMRRSQVGSYTPFKQGLIIQTMVL